MSDLEIPADDYVVRYVKPSLITEGRINGVVFMLRPKERGLSVNWLDFYENCSKNQQLDEVRASSRMEMKKNGRLAELKVGSTKEHLISEINKSMIFKHRPGDDDPSHSEILGLPDSGTPEAHLIGDLIAKTVTAVYPTTP